MTAGADRTIFYVADIHGSDVCFRKWLNAGRFYGADVLVIGGDLTGKILLPIYPAPGRNGSWRATWRGRQVVLETRNEVDELVRSGMSSGRMMSQTPSTPIGHLPYKGHPDGAEPTTASATNRDPTSPDFAFSRDGTALISACVYG